MKFPMRGKMRRVGGAYVADSATVTGDVTLADEATVWFGSVLRGDDAPLYVGRCTNIQDLTMMHADPGVENVLGDHVTVGHRVVLHGAHVQDDCLIGMGAANIEEPSDEQLDLFNDPRERRNRRLDEALDLIQDRFGGAAIQRGSGARPARQDGLE